MYGLPSFTAAINPDLYEKKEILSQIEKNYEVSKVRNEWNTTSYIKTDIHHSLEDEKNPNLKIFDFNPVFILWMPTVTCLSETVVILQNQCPVLTSQ